MSASPSRAVPGQPDETFLSRIAFREGLRQRLDEISSAGLRKIERELQSPQGAWITVTAADGTARRMLNLCANNYLGLAGSPELAEAARRAIDAYGYGMASVRFICGTQAPHAALERRLAGWLGTEAAILFPSCFDANAGLFETLFDERDAIVSDALNHASIVDGIRLCKARRLRYANGDMQALEASLREATGSRVRVIVTDGVFSMDGTVAELGSICDLASRFEALVVVDDSHAAGFIGPAGRGTPSLFGVVDQVDLVTGTLGKALGGAAGGYIAGRRELIETLRQGARPYLFSNTLPPMIAATSVEALDLVEAADDLRQRLATNTSLWRHRLREAGFRLGGRDHPITPILVDDAQLAQRMAERLDAYGIYVAGFWYPVVPKGQARIRTQISAAHSEKDLSWAADTFVQVGRELGLIG